MRGKKIFVTQPYLPPLSEFIPYLEEIWSGKTLTNCGPFHQYLETELCRYLGVPNVSLFNNGTTALITALQALNIEGEVITTPYSFVATSHALLWNGIRPVFVDIDPYTLNMDPKKIEAAITDRTSAIMPVHCYGHPCDVEAIQKIADAYNLKVIYDAAHAFGVQTINGSVLNYGSLSVLSFHATKVFNTFEGGAIVCHDTEVKRRIDELKNFGIVDEETVVAPGINGKMSEFNAALGILQLKHIGGVLERRALIDELYRRRLKDVPGIVCLQQPKGRVANYAYFPILVEDAFRISRDDLYRALKSSNINARRYFYPLISQFPMYRTLPSSKPENLPHAVEAARKVLCLPIYPDLSLKVVDEICDVIACQQVQPNGKQVLNLE